MQNLLRSFAFTSLIITGAIFGIFYAWICTVMWGLDAADPRIAIAAMQAMNAAIRNAAFSIAFFGTPIICWLTALIAWRAGTGKVAVAFALAGLVFMLGTAIPTGTISVPMNQALALLDIPKDEALATSIWQDYSPKWQLWNQIRAGFAGISLLFVGYGIFQLEKSGRV
ncbi:MAG: DUF1772 domain-containing protein [Cohaesibacteraceae bacterium]|nr:DUF1772 domain-containing protein [Cohaesibacteraceae bacterium]